MAYLQVKQMTSDELNSHALLSYFYIFEHERQAAQDGEELHDYFFDDVTKEIKAINDELLARRLPLVTEAFASIIYYGESKND